jgi:hypothetical protein
MHSSPFSLMICTVPCCVPLPWPAVAFPCKGRKASTLVTKTGSYKCGKNRFCVKTYATADAPFAFDFTALAGIAGEARSCLHGPPVVGAAQHLRSAQQQQQQLPTCCAPRRAAPPAP